MIVDEKVIHLRRLRATLDAVLDELDAIAMTQTAVTTEANSDVDSVLLAVLAGRLFAHSKPGRELAILDLVTTFLRTHVDMLLDERSPAPKARPLLRLVTG